MKNKKKALAAVLASLMLGTVGMATFASCGSESGNEGGGNVLVEDPNATHYTVTLDPNGGAFADGSTEKKTISIQEGFPIDWKNYELTFEGNDHLGWKYDDGKPFPAVRGITGDTTLVARWSATEEKAVYDMVITIGGEELTLSYEEGVYQFYYTGEIYGGYTKRGALYTIYEEELMANAKKDDGSKKRILYRANSNYVEATGGEVYALFYNDGAFELFYKYMYQDSWTDYSMLMGYWSNKGYTPPYTAPEAPKPGQGTCMHNVSDGWEKFYASEEEETPSDPVEEEKPEEAVTSKDAKLVCTAKCSNSNTMSAEFYDDGTYKILYDLSSMGMEGFHAVGNYKYSIEGTTLNVGTKLTDNGDGTVSFVVDKNTYVVTLADLGIEVKEAKEIFIANCVNSKTMRVQFMDDGTFNVQYDLSSMGSSGYYNTATGKWSVSDGKLSVGYDLVDKGDGVYEFSVGENTYTLKLADLLAAM